MSQLPSLGFKSEMYFTQTVNSFGGHCVLIDKMIKAQVSEDVCATPLHHGFLQFKVLIWTRVCTNIFHKVPIFSNNYEYDANMTICTSSSRGQRVWMLCASHWIQWMGNSGPRMALHDTSRRSPQICHTGHNGPPNSLQDCVSKGKWYQAFTICELWKRPQKTLIDLRKIECNCCLVSLCVHLWKSFHLWPLSSARELLSSWFKGYLHFPTSCGKERFSILACCGKRDFPTSLALGGKDFPTSPAVGWKIFQPH